MEFVLYLIITALVSVFIAAFVATRMVQKHHSKAVQADEAMYKHRWQEAVTLLASQGQLTTEQMASIMPGNIQKKTELAQKLTRQPGWSTDRRDTELERAKLGLPQLDNLVGMFSDDAHAVLQAHARNENKTS